MNNKVSIVLACLFLIFNSNAHSGIKYLGSWEGVWDDKENEGVISIIEKNGFLDVSGKDNATIYSCTCVVAKNNVATCLGEGVNHLSGLRFLYKSEMTLNQSGNINESWEALFRNMNSKGEATFTMQKLNSR